jgi:hypothetical protein
VRLLYYANGGYQVERPTRCYDLPLYHIGYVWLCVAVCGCVWLCVAVCGYVWLCMAMCGYVWLRVAMNIHRCRVGIPRSRNIYI